MATIRTIFQPGQTHAVEVIGMLELIDPREVRISTAYANSAGVSIFKNVLSRHANCSRVYVGVRNGATSVQGVIELFKTGGRVFLVDTGTRRNIFHTKFYAIQGQSKGYVTIGSANMTYGGMHNNIESSVLLELLLSDPLDAAFCKGLFASVDDLPQRHPHNCVELKSVAQAVAMQRAGILEDERAIRLPLVARPQGVRSKSLLIVPPIRIPYVPPPRLGRSRRARRAGKRASPAIKKRADVMVGDLLWEKADLPQSDLQLLQVGHTPGVLRLTQAGFLVNGKRIDQTSYFRKDVFGSLRWSRSPKDLGKEMAQATFVLIIAGLEMGTFQLKISHKAAWEAGQGNYTTGLHWGNAVRHIRQRGLIGRTLRLYAAAQVGGPYVIDID